MATFEARVSAEGQKSFRVKVRIKGFPAQSASFHRLTDARRWAQSTEAAIREGRNFKTSEAKRHTLADAIDRYVREVMPHKRGSKSQPYQLAWWKQQIGAYALSDVTPALISEHRELLLRDPVPPKSKYAADKTGTGTRKPATVVRYLAVLSHLFSVAVKEWQWCEDNPVRKVSKPKEPRGRVRFLSDDERNALLNACRTGANPVLYIVVVLAISTGMRRGELMGLRWLQIDFDRGAITLHMTKNGDRRRVPLAGLALQLLREHAHVRRIDPDLVFPGQNLARPVELKRTWTNALAKAGIQDFRFHDLRHCTASYLAMNGATLAEIADVLGHRTLSMVRRYTHIADAHTAKVVTSMTAKIFGKEAA